MKILITGGAGFIGSNLSNYFLNKGNEVVVFDNLSRTSVEKNLKWLKENHQNLEFIKGDIRNLDSLSDVCKDVDAIFHTASQVAVTTSVKNPIEDFEINAFGTLNVLEAARRSNSDPMIVFTSTNKVYGNNVNAIPVVEEKTRYDFDNDKYKDGIPEEFSPDANEHTPYGCSKYAADVYVRDFSAVYNLKTVVFRMSCIYGVRQFGNEDQGWVVHFILSSIFDKSLKIYGDGKQVRDILFVEDLVRAFELSINNINKTKGNVYNIGGGSKNLISLLELIDFLEKNLNKEITYRFDGWRPFDQKVYYSNINKANRDFGWEPKIPKEEGLRRSIEWVRNNNINSKQENLL